MPGAVEMAEDELAIQSPACKPCKVTIGASLTLFLLPSLSGLELLLSDKTKVRTKDPRESLRRKRH